MAEPAIQSLYEIMHDGTAGIRNRLNAAISASRVERLQLPGEAEPPAIFFLRSVVASEHAGLMFRHDYRREAAAALAYFERRATKNALLYDLPDVAEQRRQWVSAVNAALRVCLAKRDLWPQRRDVLLDVNDSFELPDIDAEAGLNAMFFTREPQRPARRRQRRIDEPMQTMGFTTESERHEIMRSVARIVAARLREFDLAA